jgi:hypothetical protein
MELTTYFPFFLGNFLIKGIVFYAITNIKKTLTESIIEIIGYHLKNKS